MSYFFKPIPVIQKAEVKESFSNIIIDKAREKFRGKNPLSNYAIPRALAAMLTDTIQVFFKQNSEYAKTPENFNRVASVIARYLNDLPTESPGLLRQLDCYFSHNVYKELSFPSTASVKQEDLLSKLGHELIEEAENTEGLNIAARASSSGR